eukprot:14199379-Alexandrium_andersonii.AAC.1
MAPACCCGRARQPIWAPVEQLVGAVSNCPSRRVAGLSSRRLLAGSLGRPTTRSRIRGRAPVGAR